MEPFNETVTGVGLREFRAALGLSQNDLATLLDVGQSTINKWERDLVPAPDRLRAELWNIYLDFVDDVRELRAGRPIRSDAPWRAAALFWATRRELALD